MNKITDKVKNFYEEIRFPNYDDDNLTSIIMKGRKNLFIKKIIEEIPSNIQIIETGCGTGQLSNFLSATTNNKIIATDLCEHSIRLAKEFNQKYISSNKLDFINCDIFNNSIKKEISDLTFALGWMHHTKNCELAFKEVLSLTKKDKYVIISLYNKIGRFKTTLILYLSKIFGKKIIKYLDPRVKKIKTLEKKNTWITDQYFNIHETRHSYNEVEQWCKKYNATILNFFPGTPNGFVLDKIFEKQKKMNFLEKIFYQILILIKSDDGGLFFCVIKKN